MKKIHLIFKTHLDVGFTDLSRFRFLLSFPPL
jgi:hypothetical protein